MGVILEEGKRRMTVVHGIGMLVASSSCVEYLVVALRRRENCVRGVSFERPL